MVDTLQRLGIGLLFAIGSDGTLKGAHEIADEMRRRGLAIGVIGVPKTIDNDISFVETSFGFETAVAAARHATRTAYVEASGHRNGIGLVKLMGRDSGLKIFLDQVLGIVRPVWARNDHSRAGLRRMRPRARRAAVRRSAMSVAA